MREKRLKAAALLCAVLFVLGLCACSAEKTEVTMADFETAVAKTGYTLYDDGVDYEKQGIDLEEARVALSEDEENRVAFYRCADKESAQRLYEVLGTELEEAVNAAEDGEDRSFTGENYQCQGAQCDSVYFYRVQVEKTVLWAKGNKQGREVITDLVLGLGY